MSRYHCNFVADAQKSTNRAVQYSRRYVMNFTMAVLSFNQEQKDE